MTKAKNPKPTLLKEFLHNLTVDELRSLNSYLPAPESNRKEDRVVAIHDAMMKGDGLIQLWTRLDDLQKAVVSEVVYAPNNYFNPDVFRSKYGTDANWGTKKSKYYSELTPSLLGLFFFRLEMPVDLKAALKSIVPKPINVLIKTVNQLPEQVTLTLRAWQARQGQEPDSVELVQRDTQLMAQHDLVAVLRLIDAGQLKVTAKTQRPTAASVRVVAGVLDGGDFYPPLDENHKSDFIEPTAPGFMRAFALPLLLLSADLAEVAGSKLQLTAAGKKALTAPPHQTLHKIWTSWLKSKLFDEFNRINTIKGQTGQGADDMTAVAPRRGAIVNTLAVLPVNQWIEFHEFSRFMQASGRTFSVSRDLWTLYVEDANYGSLGYKGFGDWHIIQARYILVFLMEYAATLGLIDIAYIPPSLARLDFSNLWGVDDYDCLSDYDGLRYLRINELGAWCLGMVNDYQPPAIQHWALFNVLPNYDIVVMGEFPASDRLMVSRFAQATSERVWRIDPNKVVEGHESSLPLSEILNYLNVKSSTPLPQTVSRLFEELSEKAARLKTMKNAHLIEVSDHQTMLILANDSRLTKHCMPAGERHLVVPAESLPAFRRAMHELGYALPQ